ncbi:MAG: hypothetical protein JJU31_07910 [Wenzhouxiangella sp.]|nr:hypothetical protein [Wenzhouxiangella sp.]MCH8477116.1 hypothetical protein [Wenzhouxiangella sp.]
MRFRQELQKQRWDDHRYYHHSRINQSLHLFSACCFLMTYMLVFVSPIAAAFTGWILAMVSRQVGHFFFEPKGFDEANKVSHEHKEAIKVGYNLHRKVVLLSLWALTPVFLLWQPSSFGLFQPHQSQHEFLHNLSLLWIYLGLGAIIFRTLQLFFQDGLLTGAAWFTKIATDPFHDIKLYHKAPIQVLRGNLYDPIVTAEGEEAEAR